MPISINGAEVEAPLDPRVSLLDLLREHLHLHGTKKGCNQGACGACTVPVDGERILSCLSLAVQSEGRAVTTIEGLTWRRWGATCSSAPDAPVSTINPLTRKLAHFAPLSLSEQDTLDRLMAHEERFPTHVDIVSEGMAPRSVFVIKERKPESGCVL